MKDAYQSNTGNYKNLDWKIAVKLEVESHNFLTSLWLFLRIILRSKIPSSTLEVF